MIKLLHLFFTGQLIMSTTITNSVGPSTRSCVKSSSETLRSMGEMVETVEQLAKRKKGASKGSPPATPEIELTTDSEELTSSSLGGPCSRGNAEPIALQIWNEMFEDDNFDKFAEGSDYIQNKVGNLLQSSQMARMAAKVVEEIERKKYTFIKTKGSDATKLREKLHKLFTTIVIRKVKSELAEGKEDVEEKLAGISADHEKREESRNVGWRNNN